jgi:tRNA(fMet)-specific endonuclease VapC
LLEVISIPPFDANAARRSAEVQATLARSDKAIGQLDTLIACTALAGGSTLVTHNTREFSRVPGFSLRDWY